MKQEKERIVKDGNAFYEIDMECLEKKRKICREAEKVQREKRQRK